MNEVMLITFTVIYALADSKFHQLIIGANDNIQTWHNLGLAIRVCVWLIIALASSWDIYMLVWSGYTIALFHEIFFPFSILTKCTCEEWGDWWDCWLVKLRDKHNIHLHIYTTILYVIITAGIFYNTFFELF